MSQSKLYCCKTAAKKRLKCGGNEHIFRLSRLGNQLKLKLFQAKGRVMAAQIWQALPVLALLCLAPPALANDGFGGITATGLTFSQTKDIAMEEEDLFISLDRVEVSYLFRNHAAQDVTGEVIFPLPPIALADLLVMDWNLPTDRGRANLLQFSAKVDGQPVQVNIDPVAVIPPEWVEGAPHSDQYDTPGRDVTAVLKKHQIPLTLDTDAVFAALQRLDPAALDELAKAGVIETFGPARELTQDEIYLRWAIVLRYHWTQTFAAGKVLRIQHSYENRPWGGVFVWSDPPKEDWLKMTAARYCIDKTTSRGIARALSEGASDDVGVGSSVEIAYVLRTANSWAGPIGKFRLTLDKGHPRNLISLCAEGIKKIGPTRFQMEKTNFRPETDLEILVVQPLN